jgi:Protein of unknown function (DUF3082)
MSASSPDSSLPPVPMNGADLSGGGASPTGDHAQGDADVHPLAEPAAVTDSALPERPRKGPLSFLSGAITSGLLAWFCLWLSRRVVAYYALHPPHYEARVAQSIATALKTMVVGMSFLATFTFAFVGLGLLLVFFRSLLAARPERPA